MKSSYVNEVTKRRFFHFMSDVKGYAQSSIDGYEHALLLWQDCHTNEDFSRFGLKQTKIFKKWLQKRIGPNGKPMALSTQYTVLRFLRQFFQWLATQPKYKSKINALGIESLSLSKQEMRIAKDASKRQKPSLNEVIQVIENLNNPQTEVDQRDRALICFTLMTGLRISALASLPMKAFDPKLLVVDQDPKIGVKTKFRKHITTGFFPIDYEPAATHFLEWYNFLRTEKHFKPEYPIFPQTVVENGAENISYYSSGRIEPVFWSSTAPIRNIFKKRFQEAKVPYYNPHTFRNLIVSECAKRQLTKEQEKAISLNFGHKKTETTFGEQGYYQLTGEKQIELIQAMRADTNQGKEENDKELMLEMLSAFKEAKKRIAEDGNKPL